VADPLIGRTIDDTYHITDVLGVGGMGVVYKARDVMLEKDVAIKMMDVRLANDTDFLKRFQQEAKALAKLQDANTVAIYALKKTDVGFCIVMEFVEGCTLADVLKESGALPPDRYTAIFRQILRAFSYAHSRGIVHRDIKPSNIMLTADDGVKITDFGLAKIQQPSGATQTMGTGGTLFYMSPEQIRGLANVDLRGDIYSLGMTLYEAATGQLPFSDTDNDFDIRQAIVNGKIKSPAELKPDIHPEMVKLILKAIHKDPDKRFQTAGEMQEALERIPVPLQAREQGKWKPGSGKLGKNKMLLSGIIAATLLIGPLLFYDDLLSLIRGTSSTTLSIASEPTGASVVANGEAIGMTPLEDKVINPGVTKLRITKDGFIPLDTIIYVGKGGSTRAQLSLMRAPATSISVMSQPAGARVSLNGKVIGVTPLEKYPVAAGIARLRIDREGYQPVPGEFSIRDGRDTSVFFVLIPAASNAQLILGVIPSGTISVDGKAQSAGLLRTTAGSHVVLFSHPQYGSKSITVGIKEDETKKLTCYFEASVSVNAKPVFGAIWVDGKNSGINTPAEITLPPGRHLVTVRRSGYRPNEGEVVVNVQPEINKSGVELSFNFVAD